MPRTSDAKARLTEAALDLIWGNSYGSTSVDAICEKAGVRKGSFYHFFVSKSDLAIEALEVQWQGKKEQMDRLFSPASPPLERLANYFQGVLERQTALRESSGSVLGCPLFSLGCEICTQDRAIGEKVRDILGRNLDYFESAIRDAHARGQIDAPDARAKAEIVFAFYEGTLAQARIENSLEPLRELKRRALELLGAPCPKMAATTAAAPV